MTKIGFDVHGVLDTFLVFKQMMDTFIADPNYEVHVITGLSRADADKDIGHLVDFDKVKYMSIVDRLTDQGVPFEWINGMPYADANLWNREKAIYCEEQGIAIMFDDSPVYGEYFDDIDTIFCQIKNPVRPIFDVRSPSE